MDALITTIAVIAVIVWTVGIWLLQALAIGAAIVFVAQIIYHIGKDGLFS